MMRDKRLFGLINNHLLVDRQRVKVMVKSRTVDNESWFQRLT